ncbi:MAG: hypothetical protein IJL71_02575 [Oscillospiraceae bacterium]|nr:hypothetical protein [Oscillospiraceae bacterium]
MKRKKFKKSVLAVLLVFTMMISCGAAFAANASTSATTNYEPSGSSPDKPDGEAPSGMPNGDPPERPEGDPPEMPDGERPDGAPGSMGGQPGGSGGVDSYDAVNEYSEDTTVSGESFTSTGSDENAVLITGGEVILNDVDVNRTSSDSTGGDDSSFYGVGAAILATYGTAYINDSTITTDSAGGAGAFAYGDGVIYIADTKISTEQNTSGGIHVAGGGTLYAYDLDVTTQGGSAAAIRSDRGGGTMVVDGGSYVSNGTGSPAIYCTADIAVNNATLTANNSEAICIEGLNSLRLYDCDLTGSMHDDSQNDCTWTVILYQSMSGDSEVGCSTYQMTGGTLTSTNGGIFYTTNTESEFIISDVEIIGSEDCEFFLKCTGNANQRGWGSTGSNGAECTFTAVSQEMNGDIIWDTISTLDLYMTDGSVLTGAFIDDESCAGNGGSGYANLYISSDSTWVVTGDSVLTALYNEGTITDENGNTVTVKGTDGTVYVNGTSEYTVTVQSCSESADFSGMASLTDWTEFETERPAVLASSGTETHDTTDEKKEQTEMETGTIENEAATDDAEKSKSAPIIIGAAGVCIAGAAAAAFIISKKKQQ